MSNAEMVTGIVEHGLTVARHGSNLATDAARKIAAVQIEVERGARVLDGCIVRILDTDAHREPELEPFAGQRFDARNVDRQRIAVRLQGRAAGQERQRNQRDEDRLLHGCHWQVEPCRLARQRRLAPFQRGGALRRASAPRQMRSQSSGKPMPTAAAARGKRLAAVKPGSVLTSRHQSSPAASMRKSTRL